MVNGYYIYAIVPRTNPVLDDGRGIGGAALIGIRGGELMAVCSKIDLPELQPTPQNLSCHEQVVERQCQAGSALPVRFGTVLTNAAKVEQALLSGAKKLEGDLHHLGGKIEMGITALWPAIGQNDDGPPSDASDPEAGQGPGARYFQRKRHLYQNQEVLRQRAATLLQQFDQIVQDCALEKRSWLLPVPGIALRAAYLLAPSQNTLFHELVNSVHAINPDIRWLLSGPWPPYSFVSHEQRKGA